MARKQKKGLKIRLEDRARAGIRIWILHRASESHLGGGGVGGVDSSVVEHLPRMCKALSLTPSIRKREKKLMNGFKLAGTRRGI